MIAPDQKVWMDRMIKEGKIAIPPGGTLEKGSLYSMFIRMLLHNAMEEQKRQEAWMRKTRTTNNRQMKMVGGEVSIRSHLIEASGSSEA